MTPAFAAFVALIGATGLLRLGELAVSRRRLGQRLGQHPDALVAEPRLFPAMALLHTALIVLPLAEVIWLQRAFDWRLAGPAIGLLVVATGLRIWTLSTLGRSWNVQVVRPDADAVVTSGPYRFIRHPNYLCVILEIIALPLFHSAIGAAVILSVFNAVVLWVRIGTEEAALSALPAWRTAFADRSRLIPGLF